jgi:hypothetical protein
MSSVGNQAKAENQSFALAERDLISFPRLMLVKVRNEILKVTYGLRAEHLNRNHQKQILILLRFYDALLSRPEPNRIETRRIATLQCRTSVPCVDALCRWNMVRAGDVVGTVCVKSEEMLLEITNVAARECITTNRQCFNRCQISCDQTGVRRPSSAG